MRLALRFGWLVSQGKFETIEQNNNSAVILCLFIYLFFLKNAIFPQNSNIPYPPSKKKILVSLKTGYYPVSQNMGLELSQVNVSVEMDLFSNKIS